MNIQKFAAFCAGEQGGNPAGVVVADALPDAAAMQRVAREVGFSETAFAARAGDTWQVRYYSPEAEIPFCGHATIALAAALAMQTGEQRFRMQLAQAQIDVEGHRLSERTGEAAFVSPPSRSRAPTPQELADALGLFGLSSDDLQAGFAPAVIHAGSDHIFLPLERRERLAAMAYDFARGQAVARERGWVTMLLAHAQTPTLFHARNAFAYGGVYEDPATGAAAAALAGHLRAQGYAPGTQIEVQQGDDMGTPCRLYATTPQDVGGRVRVSGTARVM
jgi:PhzF family phenazine biosynthesis protein